MFEIVPIGALVIGIALVIRIAPGKGISISPIGLSLVLLSLGCLFIGQIVAHAFPIGFDPTDQHHGPLSGLLFLDAPTTVAVGLTYGGIVFFAAAPFLMIFVALTRLSRKKWA